MKRGMVLIAALTLVVGGASVVSAQGGPGGPPRGGAPGGPGGAPGGAPRGGGGGQRGGGQRRGGFNLLDTKEVQQELKMTPVQITKLQTALQALRPQRPGAGGGPQPGMTTAPGKGPQTAPGKGPAAGPQPGQGPGGGRQPMSEQDREKRRAAQEKAIASVLDAKQMKRYHQLVYQRAGATALALPEVATQLKLTDSQKKQVTAIVEKARTDQRAAMQGVNFQSMTPQDMQAFATKAQAAQKATNDKVVALLTSTQKKQWTALLGTPFKFPAPAPRGGGPGGPGGGGRGQGARPGVTL